MTTDTVSTVKARNLTSDHWLADGAIILRLSFQLDWVYAKIVKGGHVSRRRYRYDQDIKIIDWNADA
jgi:hypothetical protein